MQQGYGYYENDQTVGSDKYPHQYEDYEGFSFPDPGPYYEFPILSSYKVYTGGSPGADRVIFTGDGTYEVSKQSSAPRPFTNISHPRVSLHTLALVVMTSCNVQLMIEFDFFGFSGHVRHCEHL